jgi:hypothetical protein
MDHNLGVGQSKPFALRTAGKKKCAHRSRHTDTNSAYVALDVVHRIVNGETCRNGSAGAVDVEINILVGILSFKEKKLSYDERCGSIVDLVSKEDDSVVEKSGINVVGTFSSGSLFNNVRNECHNNSPLSILL